MSEKTRVWTQVTGIPKGWALLRVGIPEIGEWVMWTNGPEQASSEHQKLNVPLAIVGDGRKWMIPLTDTPKFLPLPGKFHSGRFDPWVEGVCVQYNPFTTHKWLSSDGIWYRKFMVETDKYNEKKQAAK